MHKQSAPDDRVEEILAIQKSVSRGEGSGFLTAYSHMASWLASLDLEKQAYRTGDLAPDFLLPDHAGRLVSSRDLRSEAPLVVTFLRGGWCPFCLAELSLLQESLPDFESLPAKLVAVTPETGALPRELKRDHALSLTLLSDVDYGVGLSFGLIFSVPAEARAILQGHGIDLQARLGSPCWMLPLPATYIIGQDGRIRGAYFERDFTAISNPRAIIERLRTKDDRN